MSIEENKAIARRFIETMHEGHFDLLAEDGTFWVSGSTPFSGTKTKAEMIALFKSLKTISDDQLVMSIRLMTAEDDRVALEAEAAMTLHNGRRYSNQYNTLLVVHDGLVRSVREYSDTAHMLDVFAS